MWLFTIVPQATRHLYLTKGNSKLAQIQVAIQLYPRCVRPTLCGDGHQIEYHLDLSLNGTVQCCTHSKSTLPLSDRILPTFKTDTHSIIILDVHGNPWLSEDDTCVRCGDHNAKRLCVLQDRVVQNWYPLAAQMCYSLRWLIHQGGWHFTIVDVSCRVWVWRRQSRG